MHSFRKLLALLLIAILAASFWGAESWYAFQLQKVRRQVKRQLINQLNDAELVVFRLSIPEARALHWKHSKEFSVKGEWYDIVRASSTRDSVTYFCWHDVEETRLHRDFATLVAKRFNSNPPLSQTQLHFSHFFKTLKSEAHFTCGMNQPVPWLIPIPMEPHFHSGRIPETRPQPPWSIA